jgi:hypothetical protein
VLDRQAFRSVDTNCVVPFVECWERYYGADDREYFAELNIGNDLAEENIVRLLRWKDPRMLTHPRKADGEPNPRVMRVLEQTASLNGFRNGDLTPDEFEGVTHCIFPNGIIWQLFLFHLARPADWPIADQNVFRSYSVMFNTTVPDSFGAFGSYSKTFQRLAAGLRRHSGIDDNDQKLVIRTNKRLDNALFAFGRFLATYDH